MGASGIRRRVRFVLSASVATLIALMVPAVASVAGETAPVPDESTTEPPAGDTLDPPAEPSERDSEPSDTTAPSPSPPGSDAEPTSSAPAPEPAPPAPTSYSVSRPADLSVRTGGARAETTSVVKILPARLAGTTRRTRKFARLEPPLTRISAHGDFAECHLAPDPQACDGLLEELDSAADTICLVRRTDPECRQARIRFALEAACVDQTDPAACRATVSQNPCFVAPRSEACADFVVRDEALACRDADLVPPSFRCRIVLAATQFLWPGFADRVLPPVGFGGGSEETDRPGGRTSPGGGRTVLVGLTDPGSRGDLGLTSRVSDRGPARAPRPLARTGPASPAVLLVGVLALALGVALRRRVHPA